MERHQNEAVPGKGHPGRDARVMTERDEIKERVRAAVDLAEWIRRDGVAHARRPG